MLHAGVGPALHQLVDVPTLSGREHRRRLVRFKAAQAFLMIAPCLPRICLALFKRVLTFGECIDHGIEALQIVEVFNRTALVGGKPASRARAA